MSIRGSNFENQHPFASDHALVWAHCMPDGLLYGVDMSFTSSLFTLAPGFMLVAGRMFEITAAENISINPGNGYARIYVTIDTGGTASENSFDQVSFGVDYAANLDSFTELTQGEININQGAAVYQAEVAVLAIDNTGATAIERQMELVEAGTGGGSGAAFAAISVSYPEGSICTCSDGVKTFTAKDTSGQALFIIPYAGTWTITATATDGSGNIDSQSVDITTDGQSVSVELSYALYLIKDGVMNDEYSFELYHGNSTATTVDDVLRAVIQNAEYATWYTSKQLPLADFSRASIEIAGGAARYNFSFGVIETRETFSTEDGSPFGTNRVSVKNSTSPYTIEAQTLNFDLSNFNESMYFGFSMAGTNQLDSPLYARSGLDIVSIALMR